MAALFGDMGTSMGIPTEMAANRQLHLVGLTADLASFKNVSNDIASNALKGIFTGEGESLKSLGHHPAGSQRQPMRWRKG